jgi:hypothetical protein
MTIEINEAVIHKLLSTIDAGLVTGRGKPVPGEMCVEAAVCYALGLPHGDEPQCVSPALRSLNISLNDKNWASFLGRAAGLRRLAVAQLGTRGAFDDKEFVFRVTENVIRRQVPLALRLAASLVGDDGQPLLDAANRCESEGTWAAAKAATAAAYAAAEAAADAVADATADAAAYAAAYAAASEADSAAYAAAYAADSAAATAAAYVAASAADSAASAAAYAAEAAGYSAASAAADVAASTAAYAAAAAADAAAAYAADAAAYDNILSDFAEDVVQILVSMNAPGCQWLPLTEISE